MKLSELQQLLKWMELEYGDIEIKSYNPEKKVDEEITQNNFSWSPITVKYNDEEQEKFIRVWL